MSVINIPAMAFKIPRVNFLPPFASKLIGFVKPETSDNGVGSKLDNLRRRKFQLQQSLLELHHQEQQIVSEMKSLNEQIDSEKFLVDGTKFPLSLAAITTDANPTKNETTGPVLPSCDMDSCFDYSRCPITSTFTYFLYPLQSDTNNEANSEEKSGLKKLHETLSTNRHRVNESFRACLFIKVIESCETGIQNLENLLYWGDEGENHVIWTHCEHGNVRQSSIGRSIIVSDTFYPNHRSSFDLISFSAYGQAIESAKDPWKDLPLLFPAYRKFLICYFGPKLTQKSSQIALENLKTNISSEIQLHFCEDGIIDSTVDNEDGEPYQDESIVYLMSTAVTSTLTDCSNQQRMRKYHWSISTFSLIFPTENDNNRNFQEELFGMLKAGSIPVIFGLWATKLLPFNEVLDWSKMALVFPIARIPEIHHILKSFSEHDVLLFKKNGRAVFEKYLSTAEKIVETTLAVLRTRIGQSPVPFEDAPSPSAFSSNSQVLGFFDIFMSNLKFGL